MFLNRPLQILNYIVVGTGLPDGPNRVAAIVLIAFGNSGPSRTPDPTITQLQPVGRGLAPAAFRTNYLS